MADLVEVNACRWCDQPKQGHARRWAPGVRRHTHTPPTDQIRKFPLLALRAARTGRTSTP